MVSKKWYDIRIYGSHLIKIYDEFVLWELESYMAKRFFE